jgi:large subunit ribosomal protein L15
MPLFRRLPKRGFVSPFRVEYSVVNIADLAAADTPDRVDIAKLHELKLVRSRRRPVKVLGVGTIDRPVHVAAHAFSKSAEEKIKAAGGTCERVALPRAATAAVNAETAAPAPKDA